MKKVLARASKSKGVLTKLNWKLLDSCDSADATVNLKMEEHEEAAPAGGNVSMPGNAQEVPHGERCQVHF